MMIDIEIQISISERSSGWAINYGQAGKRHQWKRRREHDGMYLNVIMRLKLKSLKWRQIVFTGSLKLTTQVWILLDSLFM